MADNNTTPYPFQWTISEELYKAATTQDGVNTSPSYKEMLDQLHQTEQILAHADSPKPPHA